MKFPTAFTILFFLLVAVAVATHFVPAGEYDREYSESLGRDVPVPGTYKEVEPNPQGIVDVFIAPIAGFYDPGSYEAAAIDVALFVLVIGGFLMIVTKTGAIDAGIGALLRGLKGREQYLIPILMAAFAAGGTSYGMAEESLAFYALVIPVMIAAGYDSLTGVAVILLGAGIGTLGSTINPFATVIASNAAGVSFTSGIILRTVILLGGWLICVLYVMRYAARVKADPSRSLVYSRMESHRAHFLGKAGDGEGEGADMPLTFKRQVVLIIFAATFGVMIWGVSSQGWWMAEMSALFLASAILVGILDALFDRQIDDENFTNNFVDGARDMLGVALVIGLARGIVVLMNEGKITDTILFHAESSLAGLGEVAFINTMFGLNVGLSFLVPSSSGLAVLTMPILAPLADFSGVARELVVTAYQSASGWVNLFNPTFAVVMGGLALGRVPYNRWIQFVVPLLILLAILIVGCLSVAAMLAAG